MQQCERYISKNIVDRAYGSLLNKLQLSCDLAKNTRRLNRFLGIFKLRLCKDCQKLSGARDLRCYDCRIEHDEYMRERLAQEYQDDLIAEFGAKENEDHDDFRDDYD